MITYPFLQLFISLKRDQKLNPMKKKKKIKGTANHNQHVAKDSPCVWQANLL